MAMQAQADQQKRVIEVNRTKLVDTLLANKEKHIKEYKEAIEGYKTLAIEKLQKGYEDAKVKLEKNLVKGRASLEEFNPDNPDETGDYLTLVDGVQVALKVPRNYSKAYDAAIDMAKWDVRETLELSHAEFTCFVRDEWDWSREFFATSSMYKAKQF